MLTGTLHTPGRGIFCGDGLAQWTYDMQTGYRRENLRRAPSGRFGCTWQQNSAVNAKHNVMKSCTNIGIKLPAFQVKRDSSLVALSLARRPAACGTTSVATAWLAGRTITTPMASLAAPAVQERSTSIQKPIKHMQVICPSVVDGHSLETLATLCSAAGPARSGVRCIAPVVTRPARLARGRCRAVA